MLLMLVASLCVPGNMLGQITFTHVSSSVGDPNDPDYVDEQAFNLFDGKTSTKWCNIAPTAESPAWVIFKASEQFVMGGYSITTGNDNAMSERNGRNPKDWKIYGSHDEGKTWTEIVSVTDDNVLQDVNETTYDYEINTKPEAYTYYKWEITANHGAYSFQVSEFSLKAFVCSSGNHPQSLKHLEKKESTCTEHGIAQDCYYCYACGKYYSDENGTNELGKSAVILPFTSSHNYVNGVCTICGKIKNLNNAGTAADPYLINTPQALEWFRDWVNGTYSPDGGTAVTHPEACAKLTADIDMSTICHPADKANDKEELSWTPISDNNVKWKGSFDGGGHTISNLYINSTSDYAGLFGYVGDNATNINANKSTYIKDIAFSNVKATFTNQYSGTLAGYIGNVSVSGITVESGTINGKSILGGIVGKAYYSVISNCVNKVNIESEQTVGGICGILDYSTIEGCANYGTIEISSIRAGGIAGFTHTSTTINNCANYGDIIGSHDIGGIIGTVCRRVDVDNDVSLLFSCGNVTCDTIGGMLFGCVIGFLHINDAAIYSSDAVLTLGGSPVETVAIGEKYFIYNETNCKGYNTYLINSGIVTWLLQNKNEIWGQDLGEESKEPYPVLGSKKVYPVGDVHFDCSNTIILGGSFSNTDSGGKYTDIPYRDYHEFGSDGLCTTCGFAAPEVTEGDNSIPVKAVPTSGTLENQMGYTIYKYVATSDGTLYITSEGESDTYGTLWDAGFTLLASNDNKCVGETNFFISYDVVKGTTYFIGVREKSGAAIDGTCSLKIAGSWSPDDGLKKPIDLLGIGTQESPFELKNAKHLLWFSHYVNGTYEPETGATASLHPEACAKMIADIDLSSVCHPADAENSVEEVNWIPICKNYEASCWYGTFDGGGHTISNLYYKGTHLSGLFGDIQGEENKPGTIKDIVFTNVSIDNYNSGADAGTVAGCATYINISGIFVESGSIAGGNDTGGIVGNYGYGIISNCSNKINITSKQSDAGGICGKYAGSKEYIISNCANYGNISGSEDAGGIVGFTYWTSTIKDVFSSGDVTISTSGRKSFGLIVGLNRDKLIFDGVIAFNKEATLKNSVDGIIEGKAVGEISDGATLTGENIPQGFTKDQQRSGYLTYVVMNNGKAFGTQVWGQQLGTNDYPVLGSDYKVIRAARGDMDANGDYPYWATFSNQSCDSDLGGLNVYTAKVSEGVLTITRCSDKIVAKGEGVLVKGSTEYLNAQMLNTTSATAETNNDLVATPDETEVIYATSGHKLYRLTYNDVNTNEHLGFYWGMVIEDGQVISDDGSQLKATPNKAYLDVTTAAATGPFSAAPARGFAFPGDGETTGIECITITDDSLPRNGNAEGIFDLQGRKVSKPTKGVYINNGKKVIIK